jgi:hypothetical protein
MMLGNVNKHIQNKSSALIHAIYKNKLKMDLRVKWSEHINLLQDRKLNNLGLGNEFLAISSEHWQEK